jgi:hypothetical protein
MFHTSQPDEMSFFLIVKASQDFNNGERLRGKREKV